MAWRVHLTNQAIRQLNWLSHRKPTVVAWTHPELAYVFDLVDGKQLEKKITPSPPRSGEMNDAWRIWEDQLKVLPQQLSLPQITTKAQTIYTTDDANVRLYRSNGSKLTLRIHDQIFLLDTSKFSSISALGFDFQFGTTIILDSDGRVHIYQQEVYLGQFEIGLELQTDFLSDLAIPHGGAYFYATDGNRIIKVDANGEVILSTETHYRVAQIACSPKGEYLVAIDTESGLIRVYESDTLQLRYQKFGIDLLVQANPIQLMEEIPSESVAIGSVLIHDNAMLAFTMSGVVCGTSFEEMDAIPPRMSTSRLG